MEGTALKMVLAGVLFDAWPILMNRSGLSGMHSTAAFIIIVFVTVMPFALWNGITLSNTNWSWAIAAGLCSAAGLIAFNSGLAEATPQTVGKLFVTMIVVQTAVPALYHVIMNGQLTLKASFGFGFAFIAALLLV